MNKATQSNTVFISSTVRDLGLLGGGQAQPMSSCALHGDTEGRAVASDRAQKEGWGFHWGGEKGGKGGEEKRESVSSLLPIEEETCAPLGAIQTSQKFWLLAPGLKSLDEKRAHFRTCCRSGDPPRWLPLAAQPSSRCQI